MNRLFVLRAAVLLCFALPASAVNAADAQNYPVKSIRLIVGYSPGGGTDVLSRVLAKYLGESFKQTVIVDNRPGAGGILATELVAKAPPDGYTLLTTPSTHSINPGLYAKLPYDPIKDFTAVSLVAVSPNVVVVNPQVPAKTLPELVQLIKNNPGKYSYAGPGVGSTPHLGGELFRLTYKLDLVHVPFTGAAPAVQSTVGGHTPIAFTALPSSFAAIQAGQVRAIGIAATERAASVPDIATFAEQGVKDQEADTVTGIVAPAGTPKEIVELLSREIKKAAAQPDVRDKLTAMGFKPVASTPDEFGARIKLEIDKWGKVVRDANLKIE
jgi:tripartite-type tricarboxylate transporter receptor subunit TctC